MRHTNVSFSANAFWRAHLFANIHLAAFLGRALWAFIASQHTVTGTATEDLVAAKGIPHHSSVYCVGRVLRPSTLLTHPGGRPTILRAGPRVAALPGAAGHHLDMGHRLPSPRRTRTSTRTVHCFAARGTSPTRCRTSTH